MSAEEEVTERSEYHRLYYEERKAIMAQDDEESVALRENHNARMAHNTAAYRERLAHFAVNPRPGPSRSSNHMVWCSLHGMLTS